MLYFAILLAFIVGIVIAYKIFVPVCLPNMELTGVMTKEELKARATDLAACCLSSPSGSFMSIDLISSTINKAYKQISKKVGRNKKCLDFEKWIYDNYYKLNEILLEQKRLVPSYNKLAGYKNMPRIFLLAELIVKGSGAVVSESDVKYYIDAFNEILPLKFNEVCMLPQAINLALMEYVAIFCARSLVINDKFNRAKKDIFQNKINYDLIKYNSYAYAFVKYADGDALRSFNSVCAANGASAYKKADNFLAACARYTGAVSSAIKSAHKAAQMFSDEYILSISPLNNFLEECKGVTYKICTTQTKYTYLQYISSMTKKASEIAFAGNIVKKAVKDGKDIANFILPKTLGKIAIFAYFLLAIVYTISNCMTVQMFVPQYKIIVAIIFAPISFCISLKLIGKINVKIFSRRFMPRAQVNKKTKAMIVFPVVVFDEKEVDEMVDNLLTVSFANTSKIFSYGLLLDLPAAYKDEYSIDDQRIIKRVTERFKSLDDRYNLFIRKRTKVQGEDKFQGWEKKRGAILELNNLIMTDINSSFEVVSGNSYHVDYVITLDSDTMINCAYELVEIMEHPFNADKAVVGLNAKTEPSTVKTRFAAVMSDSVGLNGYTSYVADTNYDLFNSGNYTGKGIYRVKDFSAKVGEIFMDNRVLSHDFVEGAIAGCGNSGQSALDSYPQTFSSYLSRNIRWLRGDYQLLPYLLPSIKNGKNKSIKNPLSAVAKMHILCNIIFGLVPISSAALIVISLFSSSPLLYIGIAFALNLLSIVASIRLLFFEPKRIFYEFARQLLEVTCLPTVAYNYLKAILLTLYRLIAKRNLLDWKVFAHSGGKVSFAPNVFATVVFIVAAIINFSWIFVGTAALFALGILYANLLGKQKKDKKVSILKAESLLKKIASSTWIYFEKQLQAQNNYFPFDNYQVKNSVGYAPRTSPTDIAFMITSLCSARKMDFITQKDFFYYADKVLSSIERADKWRGNLYNWLDIYSLCRLNGYVSAVDSGNLLAALILLRNMTCGDVKSRANTLIQNTDIGAFFDEDRGLLRIGYNEDSKSFDLNHYDMLGSESMLTYLVGIGTGKIKSSAFKNLSGRCVKYKGSSLYSWTGGAFEYMMSGIFFRYHMGSTLLTSAKSVLRANKAYAKKQKLPFWGVSESQYAAFDDLGNYQYKAFGVPNISLSNEKRKAVASPYSSLLFLQYFPTLVEQNLLKICDCGLLGEDGLYEAYDGEIIKTYMAHHQGMILASICNYFCDGALQKALASPDMKAAALLITASDKIKGERKKEYDFLSGGSSPEKVKEFTPPKINLMTGGRYSVLIDSLGNGYSYFDGKYVSRYYNYSGGLKLFLNQNAERIDLQKQDCYFSAGKTDFVFRNDKCEIAQSVCALPNINGEARCVFVKNLSSMDIKIELESYMEIALAELYKDISHKTFSGMFVSSFYSEELDALIVKRDNLFLAHYFDVNAKYQSNRANFFGRTSGSDFGRVLDPIVSGKIEICLKRGECKSFCLYNIVSGDFDKLKKQIRLTKSEGYFDKALSGCELVANGHGITKSMASCASKLIYGAKPNLLDGDLPLVYIESNTVTPRIQNKIKMLSALSLWGIRVRIAFVYYGDGFTCQRIHELLDGIVKNNCVLTVINKESDGLLAAKAKSSATNIDEISFSEVKAHMAVSSVPQNNATLPKIEYAYKLGKGGFLADGSYAIELGKNDLPPRPWSNIISNKNFGTLVTESGGGYTYYKNSRENKLTEWSNDPVVDECSEGIVMFEDGVSWSCAVQPIKADGDYQVIHGFGYTEFRSNCNGFYSRLREYISGNTKYYEVTLTSCQRFDRTVEILFFVSPVVGDFRFKTNHNLSAEFNGSLSIKNLHTGNGFVMGSDKDIVDYVCHKQSFTDKFGNIFNPKCDFGHEFKPAIKIKLNVSSLSSAKAVFYLSADNKVELTDSESMINRAKSYYSSLSCLTLTSGNSALDYLSKWLPYQVLTSRFFGRTGFYQAGGAIGFRDQLQDCLAVLYIDPSLVKQHILYCAAHQFEAGDVQHWWHEPRTGVRTKIMDDRLFLPFITAEYIEFTGDNAILGERVPYLADVKIVGKDYYGSPEQTVKTGTLLEHCLKAIKATAKLGENGLVLIYGGDWNDAMDKVGIKGKGTTVWGSMFLYFVVNKFMPYIKNKKPYVELKDRLKRAIDGAWDGEWYTRAYCDDGTVLGSNCSKECNIDLITQSFAAISGAGEKNKTKLALLSAANRLVDTENGIIKLLTPPFEKIEAGYISDYPPGVRENGGQYTHGAVWYIMSLFEIGEWEYAYSLLNMINPVNHSNTVDAVKKYEVEPYVISADVYSVPGGTGGWSWYTGAASWYYYVVVKYLFGITFCGDIISVSPKLPKSVLKASFKIRKDGLTFSFVINNKGDGEWRIYVGERGYSTNSIKLTKSLLGKEITVQKS